VNGSSQTSLFDGAAKAPVPESAGAAVVEGSRKAALETAEKGVYVRQSDAPLCHECGALMVRNGSCYKCSNCGSTSGCS
jgi:ribonucleoside-diphosphate reductase alpha chain